MKSGINLTPKSRAETSWVKFTSTSGTWFQAILASFDCACFSYHRIGRVWQDAETWVHLTHFAFTSDICNFLQESTSFARIGQESRWMSKFVWFLCKEQSRCDPWDFCSPTCLEFMILVNNAHKIVQDSALSLQSINQVTEMIEWTPDRVIFVRALTPQKYLRL